MSLLGSALMFHYRSGLRISATYESASQLHWHAITGPAAGQSGREQIAMAEVRPDLFFVSWLEASGTTVSQVIDMQANTVYSYVSFNTPDGRRAMSDHGTLQRIDQR
jgi:hypothetical protein